MNQLAEEPGGEGLSLPEMFTALMASWKLVVFGSLAVGLVALGIAMVVPPVFTASTTFLPPQQQSSAAGAVLSSLGSLAALTGGAAAQTPSDRYVALMRSATVSDRIVDAFKLMEVYDVDFRIDARKKLAENIRFDIGKRDGLITVEFDDRSPQRAADIANRYVDELRRMTESIALTEAQQRRKFFEAQLLASKEKLVVAQQALQASGLGEGAIRAEPRSAAEGYARLKAELTAAEVRLSSLRSSLTDSTPEVLQQLTAVAALRQQLAALEKTTDARSGPDYISKYREFKYQEALFELFARQYELARADESREGALIQVVDKAAAPEKKSKPKRAFIAAAATFAALIVLSGFVLIRRFWRQSGSEAA